MAPTLAIPVNCPITSLDNPTTIIPRHKLFPSVHTFLPRADNPDGESNPPHHRYTRPYTSPIEIVVLIGIVALFAGLICYLIYTGIVACTNSNRWEQNRGKGFSERAGEIAEDRARRLKKWKEDREEESEDFLETTKNKIHDGFEATKKNVKDGCETTKKKAKDSIKTGGKSIKDQTENAKRKTKDAKNERKAEQKNSDNWIEERGDEFNKIGETVQEWYKESVKKTQEFFDPSKNCSIGTGEQTPLIDKTKDKADSATKETKGKANMMAKKAKSKAGKRQESAKN